MYGASTRIYFINYHVHGCIFTYYNFRADDQFHDSSMYEEIKVEAADGAAYLDTLLPSADNSDSLSDLVMPPTKRQCTSPTEEDKIPAISLINEHRPETNREIDEFYHFAMQLIPALRAMPAHRSMSVRAKIMAVIAEEMSAEVSNSQPASSSTRLTC